MADNLLTVIRVFHVIRAIIASVSLLLGLATAIIWIRSYFTADHFSQYTTIDVGNRSERPIVQAQIGKGGIGFNRIFWSAPSKSFPGTVNSEPLNHFKQTPHYPDFGYRPSKSPLWGFKVDRIQGALTNGSTVSIFAFVVPLWSLLLVFLLLAFPELLYRYRLWKRRRNPILCTHCGYDLRASPDRCPECGQAKSLAVAG